MKRRLWYNTWTEEYMEGLPVGNGRLAAMMVGRPERLRIALNHEWLWRGENRFREQPDVSSHLSEIREALLAGDFLKGTTLANEYLGGLGGISGVKGRVDPYQPAGDVWIELDAGDAFSYNRSLNMDTGLAETSYESPTGMITEKVFASCTDDCLITEVTSERPTNIAVVVSRKEDPVCTLTYKTLEDGLIMNGSFQNGISFETHVRIHTDGSYVIKGDRIQIQNASHLIVLINIGTDAKGGSPVDEIRWPAALDYTELYKHHKTKFLTLWGDSVLHVDIEDHDDLPTDERIRRFREGNEPSMPLLYFEYGRYLMVSGSTAELPLNLQGKWNEDLLPPWDCDYHLDINLQMNYWFVETLGMKHAANTLFNLIERYVPYGHVMAKHLYGCKGVTLTLQTDVWGRVTPEAKGWAVWLGAAPWLGQHMFMHWRHTKDFAFLRDRCYPYLKECAAFYEDYLVEHDNELWILPSQSPENRFVGTGDWPVSIGINSAMDVELVMELLQNAMESAAILGVDADLIVKWQDILARLPKLGIDSTGRLNEWDQEREEVEPEHRHLSHIYGLYPSQLFEPGSREWIAAERSLDARLRYGSGQSGWGRAWIGCLMARLGRGEEAWEHFMALIGDFATISLLDLYPPRIFQIEGNMGGTACVCEMLMQSRRGELRLLPALPKAWPKGRVENFYAQDGVKATFEWEDGQLNYFALIATEDQALQVISGDRTWDVQLKKDVPYIVTI